MLKKSIIVAFMAMGGLHGFAAIAGSVPATVPVLPFVETQKASPLEFTLSVQKIVLKNGKEQRVDAADAEPGEVLEYRAEYKNAGKRALGKILVTLPLPEQTAFIEGSAHPAGMTVSTRAAKDVFKAPRPASAGKSAATPGDAYGALRWSIEKLAPGQTAVVSARVRVDALTQQKSPAAGG